MLLAHASADPLSWSASVHPIPLIGLVAAVLLYERAVRVLRGRRRHVQWHQRASFHLGILLVAGALLTPLDALAHHTLTAHMAQHLLLADLASPLLLLGMRAPVLYFFWPRPVLVTGARITPARRLWGWLIRPRVAVTAWLAVLYAWHVPHLYEAALHSGAVHVVQHLSFAFAGMLAWWPLLDPTHHRIKGQLWKAMYVMVARTVGGLLGIFLIVAPWQVYGYYGSEPLAYGMTPLGDQQVAGALMMAVDFVIVSIGFFFFLSRSGADADGHPRRGTTEAGAPGAAAPISRNAGAVAVHAPAGRPAMPDGGAPHAGVVATGLSHNDDRR